MIITREVAIVYAMRRRIETGRHYAIWQIPGTDYIYSAWLHPDNVRLYEKEIGAHRIFVA